MKKVYLVHKSGERLGPFERDRDSEHRYWIDGGSFVTTYALNVLGFRIEEALPEKITVTWEMVKAVCRDMRSMYPEDVWRALCEEAGK